MQGTPVGIYVYYSSLHMQWANTGAEQPCYSRSCSWLQWTPGLPQLITGRVMGSWITSVLVIQRLVGEGGAKGAAAPQQSLDSILRFAQIRWELWTHRPVGDRYGKDWKSLMWLYLENPVITNVMMWSGIKGEMCIHERDSTRKIYVVLFVFWGLWFKTYWTKTHFVMMK